MAATNRITFAIENWPGPDNDFIATTPAGWRKLFGLVSDGRLGLEFDPSHLIRTGIDPYKAFEEVADRVKLLHGKDASIDAEQLQAAGYHGAGWWRYRLPGSGRLDWPAFLAQSRKAGFDGYHLGRARGRGLRLAARRSRRSPQGNGAGAKGASRGAELRRK